MAVGQQALRRWRDEASARFMGRGAVVGVGLTPGDGLVILLSRPDAAEEQAIRRWALDKPVRVELVVSGTFAAAAGTS